MDWFTILMIIIFFVAPVIQQILEAKKKNEAGTVEPPEIDGEGYRRVEVPAPVGTAGDRPRASDQRPAWSDGWSAWPTAEPAEGGGRAEEGWRGAVDRPAPARPRPPEAPPREYVLRERPVETLESRAPRQVPAPPRVAVPIPAPTPAKVRAIAIAPSRRTVVTPPSRPHRAPAQHPHLAILRSGHPQDLRDMIVVSEILSPPKGLRDLE